MKPVLLTALAMTLFATLFQQALVKPANARFASAHAANLASLYEKATAAGAVNRTEVRSVSDAIALLRAGVDSRLSLPHTHFVSPISEAEGELAKNYLSLENGVLYFVKGNDPRGDDREPQPKEWREAGSEVEWLFNRALDQKLPGALLARTPEAALQLLEGGIPDREGNIHRLYPLTSACRKRVLAALRFEHGWLECTDPAKGPAYETSEDHGYSIWNLSADAEELFSRAKAAGCRDALTARSVADGLSALRRGMRAADGTLFKIKIYRGVDFRRVAAKLAFENGKLVRQRERSATSG